MFIVDFANFLNFYSQDVLIVSFLVAISSAIIDKFLTLKEKLYIKMLTPFILGIMIFFLYNVLIKGIIDFSFDTVSAGLLSGSLSSVIFAFFEMILSGKTNTEGLFIIALENILDGYVNKEFITKLAIEIIEKAKKESDEKLLLTFILEKLKENKTEGVTDNQIEILSNLCLIQVKNLYLCKKKTA